MKKRIPARRPQKRQKGNSAKDAFVSLKRWVLGLVSGVFIVLSVNILYAQEIMIWEPVCTQAFEGNFVSVCFCHQNNTAYAATDKAVYRNPGSQKQWQRIFRCNAGGFDVRNIACTGDDMIFVATSEGLYCGQDGKGDWRRVFHGRDEGEKAINYIYIDPYNPDLIYLCTEKGLFRAGIKDFDWQSCATFLNKKTKALAATEGLLLVCTDDGLYTAKRGSDFWQRIYVAKNKNNEDQESDYEDQDSQDQPGGFAGSMNHISAYGDIFYIATSEGAYLLKETAEGPVALGEEGLLTKKINFIMPCKDGVYAATDRGIFLYDDHAKRFKVVSSGMASFGVNAIGLSCDEKYMFAATKKGLFKAGLPKKYSGTHPVGNISKTVYGEPTIQQLQEKAIEYAEVSNRKIEWMRNAAMKKAWLPDFTASLNGDMDRSLHVDTGSTATPDLYIEGPKDKGWGWDLSASWDLGGIIWNDDQTNIDVRSRLMVQLRNDILDEVTKLYYERERAKLEIAAANPEDESFLALKRLRLEELTASIDALTGGWFSRSIERPLLAKDMAKE